MWPFSIWYEMIEERSDHPWLVTIASIGIGLLALGFITDVALDRGMVSGFLTIYGVLFLGVTAFGYLSSYMIRFMSTRHSETLT